MIVKHSSDETPKPMPVGLRLARVISIGNGTVDVCPIGSSVVLHDIPVTSATTMQVGDVINLQMIDNKRFAFAQQNVTTAEQSVTQNITIATVNQTGSGGSGTAGVLTAGSGLGGGGNMSSNVSLYVNAGDGISVSSDLVSVDSTVVRTSRTISAGSGLTGGGTLESNRSLSILLATTSGLNTTSGLAVGQGNGISVGASSVAVNQAFAFSWTAAHAFGAGLTATTGTFTSGLNVGSATGAANGRIASIGSNSGTASDYIGAQFDYTQSAVGATPITAYAYRATARATHTSGVLSGLQSNSTVAEFAGAGGTTNNGEVLTSYAVVSSGATVGTLNMIKVFAPAVSGAVNTLVGLRISSMTGASSNWSIYTEGGAHYFTGDTTQVGTLSVNAGLNVGGATGATTGQIRASAGISGASGTFTGGINVGSATGADTGEVRANTLSLAGATQGDQGQIRTYAAYVNSDFRGLTIANTGNASLTFQTASISLLGANESARLVGGNQNSGDGAPGFFAVWTRANSGTIEERLRINSAGNVGIGIAAPVANASRFVHLSGVASELHLTSDLSGHGQTDGLSIQMWSDGIAYFIQRENAAMEFWTNNAKKVVIDSAGRLGIGNFPPSYSLDVSGNSRVSSSASPRIIIESTAGSNGASSRSFLRFSGATVNDFMSIGYYPDASPRRMHINYNDESALLPIMSLTADNRVGINTQTPSHALDVSGNIKATGSVISPLITTESGSLTITPESDLILNPQTGQVILSTNDVIQSSGYQSQTSGMRISQAGEADFRYIYTDELHAKAFIADLEQALAGGQIISKSVAILAENFTIPSGTIPSNFKVLDLPSAKGMRVFETNDVVGFRIFDRGSGGLRIGWAWGTVTNYVNNLDGTQTWTFTRLSSDSGTASGLVNKDSIVLDFGQSGNGYHEINAIDGMQGANSPYSQTVTWTTSPKNRNVRSRTGNLRGIFASSTTQYAITITNATAGNFSIWVDESNTGNIAFNASAATVQTLVRNITNSSATVTGTAGSYTVTLPSGYAASQFFVKNVSLSTNAVLDCRFIVQSADQEFGFYAGNGTSASSRYIRASDKTFELVNTPLSLYQNVTGTLTETVKISGGDPSVSGNNPFFAMGTPLPTGVLAGNGIWMGRDSSVYKFRVGSASNNNLLEGILWDGSALTVKGKIEVTGTSTVGTQNQIGIVPGSSPYIAIGDSGYPTSSTQSGNGIWMGASNNVTLFRVGQFTNGSLSSGVYWDGTTFAISGDLTAQSGYFAGPVTLSANGGIWQGAGAFANPSNGMKIWADTVSEVFQINLSGATSGTFTITVGANTTSPALSWNASAATVQSAVTNLASVGTGNATVTLSSGVYLITFIGARIGQDLAVSANLTGIVGGTKTATTIRHGSLAGKIAAFDSSDERVVFGNLKDAYDYTEDNFGLAAGRYATSWIGIDAINGIRVMNSTTERFRVTKEGVVTVGNSSAASEPYISIDNTNGFRVMQSTTEKFRIATSGTLLIGDQNESDPFISMDSTNGIRIRDGSVTEFQVDLNGNVIVGPATANNVQITSSALNIRRGSANMLSLDSTSMTINNSAGSAVITMNNSGGASFSNTITVGTEIGIVPGANPYIAIGGTAYPTGFLAASTTGIWMGSESNLPKMRVGTTNASGVLTSGMQWDGSSLTVNGAITAQSGSIEGILSIGANGELRQGAGTLGTNFTGLRIWTDGWNSTYTFTVTATGGSFTMTYLGVTTSPAVAYNATAATLQAALTGLSSIGSGNATVTKSGNVFTVVLSQSLASGYGDLTASGTSLTGGSITRAVTVVTRLGRIAGYGNNTQQWYAGTDGSIRAGNGSVVINSNGISVFPSSTSSVTRDGSYYFLSTLTTNYGIYARAVDAGTKVRELRLINTGTADFHSISLEAQNQITMSGVDGIVLYNSLSASDGINVGSASGAAGGQIKASAGISGTDGTFTGGLNVGSATGATAGQIKASAGITATTASFSSTLAVTGAATFSSTLAVTQATTLSSTLAVTGASTLSGGYIAPSSNGSAVFAIDSSAGSSTTLAQNGTMTPFGNANNFAGLVMITNTTNRAVGLFLVGSGIVMLSDSSGNTYSASSGTASRINVFLNSNVVTVNNTIAANRTVIVTGIRLTTQQA